MLGFDPAEPEKRLFHFASTFRSAASTLRQ
jgi:hypothetical protein